MRFGFPPILLVLLASTMACDGEAPEDPVPAIDELECSTKPDGDSYTGIFSFHYQDSDEDLDERGGAVKWWIDSYPQTEIPLDTRDLGDEGILVLNLTGFFPYEKYDVRFQVVDGAGNLSNRIGAALDTDHKTCAPLSED